MRTDRLRAQPGLRGWSESHRKTREKHGHRVSAVSEGSTGVQKAVDWAGGPRKASWRRDMVAFGPTEPAPSGVPPRVDHFL